MRTVVTGGAGFIGSHLIEALLARGDEVVCVERPGSERGWLKEAAIEWAPVGLDPVELKKVFSGSDVVYHVAGLTEARTPAEHYGVNTEGTARVIEAATAQLTPPHIIFLSSLAAIGPCRNGDTLSRHTVPHPLSHYGLSKLFAEAIVHAHADRVPVTILRLSSVYGPRERAVLKMFQLVRLGVALTVGGWDRKASLIYVKDAVGTLVAAASAAKAIGQTYCLAHPQPIRWLDFAREVGDVMGRQPILLSIPTPVAWPIARTAEVYAKVRRVAAILNRERVREISQARWVCDPTEAFADTGYVPRYPLATGIRETAAWYKEVGWL
jgi:nucleoside-diphosphate-sugar epimerase